VILITGTSYKNFWTLQGDPNYGHELQNFVKNLGIAAGLLVLAGRGDKC